MKNNTTAKTIAALICTVTTSYIAGWAIGEGFCKLFGLDVHTEDTSDYDED